MSTQIAQQLQRIENAKDILLEKAKLMGLRLIDEEEGGSILIKDGDTIDKIAGAYDDIDIIDDIETDCLVNGNIVRFPEGYIPNGITYSYPAVALSYPSIEVDPDTGVITSIVTQEEAGYIGAQSHTSEKQITHTYLKPQYIKDGVSIFGIEGTFTEDASLGEDPDGAGGYVSSYLTEGHSGYSKGNKVVGTMTDMPGETIVSFDPLTQETQVVIGKPARVNYMTMKLTDDLLTRLTAI